MGIHHTCNCTGWLIQVKMDSKFCLLLLVVFAVTCQKTVNGHGHYTHAKHHEEEEQKETLSTATKHDFITCGKNLQNNLNVLRTCPRVNTKATCMVTDTNKNYLVKCVGMKCKAVKWEVKVCCNYRCEMQDDENEWVNP